MKNCGFRISDFGLLTSAPDTRRCNFARQRRLFPNPQSAIRDPQ